MDIGGVTLKRVTFKVIVKISFKIQPLQRPTSQSNRWIWWENSHFWPCIIIFSTALAFPTFANHCLSFFLTWNQTQMTGGGIILYHAVLGTRNIVWGPEEWRCIRYNVQILEQESCPATRLLLSVLKERGIYIPHDLHMYLGVSGMKFMVRFPTQMQICHLPPFS